MDPIDVEMNGAHTTIERRVINLASGGYATQRGFCVLGDYANFFAVAMSEASISAFSSSSLYAGT